MFLPIVFRPLLVDHKKKCTGRRLKNEMQFPNNWSHFKQLQPKEQKQKQQFSMRRLSHEPAADACDDGRAGTESQKQKEVNAMTDDKQKNQDGEDLVEERKKERQETMDKMSIDTSEAHTYDKNASEDGEKCS